MGMGSQSVQVPAEKLEELKQLRIIHHSNLAMTHMKLAEAAEGEQRHTHLEKAKTNCTKGLAVDADNVKCLFRRGKVLADLGVLDQSKMDLKRVLEMDPGNNEAKRVLHSLK